jgi:hypothetical protein
MANVTAQFQLFAITFLLCTPSELHQAWIEEDLDWPTLADKLSALGCSADAIASAKVNIHDPITNSLQDTFKKMASALTDVPMYDVGMHPAKLEAAAIISAARGLDGMVAPAAAVAMKPSTP